MSKRLYNFSAGPAVLPVEVLETVKENIVNYNNTGLGVMEMSHRSKPFIKIAEEAEANLRELLSISDDYAVLFLQGGATLQFSMAPMNILGKDQVANYLISGYWSEKALAEAKKVGETHVAASSKDKNHTYIPKQVSLSEKAAYLHFTSNNTIFGTQFKTEPQAGAVPLVCDASSDFLHKKLDVSKYGIIYAGAQKNLGPSGVTVVILRKDLLSRIPQGLPIMLDYKTHVENKSMYNTPPTFPIYVVGEVLKWLKKNGGLDAMEKRNRDKAKKLYDALDASSLFTGVAEKDDRSIMNVTFRSKSADLDQVFIKESEAAGFVDLKGHRSVGGMRASIYNAFPLEGIDALIQFIQQFEKKNG